MSRGTTNRNVRGNTRDREARRWFLMNTYAADRLGYCRCYRCGKLLLLDEITVDRIIPGSHGGTYRRDNIRPACATCNSATGVKAKLKPKPKRRPKLTVKAALRRLSRGQSWSRAHGFED